MGLPISSLTEYTQAVASIVEEYGSWEGVYREVPAAQLPWNAGAPDPDLVSFINTMTKPSGIALDIGTGPGHDAAFLAASGFSVLACDISKTAIELAKQTIDAKGYAQRVDLRETDILELPLPPRLAFAYDRGCWHFLNNENRQRYLKKLHASLDFSAPFLLRTFSDLEEPGPGPKRFSKEELEAELRPLFDVEEIREGIFAGPRGPKAYLSILRKPEILGGGT